MKRIVLLTVFLFFTIIGHTQDLKITEIMYNPSGADTNWEWVEIYNSGSETIDLSGYVFDDSAATPLSEANISSGSIDPESAAILFNSNVISMEQFKEVWGNVNAIGVSVWPTLGNGGDGIGIWDSFTNYEGDNQNQVNAIEQLRYDNTDDGWPNEDGKASIFLIDLAADNEIGSNWALSEVGVETPLNTAFVSMELHGNSGNDIGSPANQAEEPDTESPVITCPEDVIVLSDVDNCGASFPPEIPTATDNSDGVISFEGVRSDNLELIFPFPVGETIITWTAIDESGNISETCMQRIVVNDEVAPEINCSEDINIESADGNSVSIEVTVVEATDQCEDNVVVTGERSDQEALDALYPLGVTTILWRAVDAVNNVSECEQTITVSFNASEEKAIIAFLIPNQVGETVIDTENKTIVLTMPFATPVENLIPEFLISENATVSPESGVSQDFTNPVVYTVTAQDGSTEEWTVTVTTEADSANLVIECPATILVQSDSESCGATVVFEIVFSDSQSEAILELSHESGSLFPIGTTEVMATATDSSGNSSSCTFLISVEDNTAPILVCNEVSVRLDNNGNAQIALEDVYINLEDTCEIASLTASQLEFSAADLGANEIMVTASDINGNETTCTSIVTVLPFEEEPLLAIQSFTLINADTNEDLFFLEEGMLIDINDLPTLHLDIRANATAETESVRLSLEGAQNTSRTESLLPFALFQDLPIGNYMGNDFIVGNYTVSATPYADDSLRGEMGEAFSLNFELFNACENFQVIPETISEVQTCNGENGGISVTTLNGIAPIRYSWGHDDALEGAIASNLGEGDYTVVATDANNCTAEFTFTLKNPALPEVSLLPFEAVFDTDEPIVLIEGSPVGGIYSGMGISDGEFDPSVGPGLYEITYTYTDEITECENSITGQIEVLTTQELVVESYTLMNADTNEVLFQLEEGMRIDINTLPTLHLDIRANTSTDVESVRLSITGALTNSRTESLLPYAFFRDLPIGNYLGADFIVGNYNVSATPYSDDSLRGTEGNTIDLNFELFDGTLAITDFMLVNADTNQDLFLLKEGMVIDINTLPTLHLDIRANTSDDVESVRLSLTGALTTSRTESLVPFALFQDLPIGNYKGNDFIVGNYEVSAVPYSEDSLRGEQGSERSLNFELVDDSLGNKRVNSMIISPNPANGETKLSFKFPTEVQTIGIYDTQGRLIRTYDGKKILDKEKYRLEIKALQTGNYYIKAIDNLGQLYHGQLLIKKE